MATLAALAESIDGSRVSNSTTYTKSDGSLGQAAAVAFQTGRRPSRAAPATI